MKKEDFEKLKPTLKSGMMLSILYRQNWRGGDGRPHDHRSGKWAFGEFHMISHNGILLYGADHSINYKAIKEVKITR